MATFPSLRRFEITEGPSAIHGIGCFATNHISRGTLILIESPLIRMFEGASIPHKMPGQDPRWQTWLTLPGYETATLSDRFKATSLSCGSSRYQNRDVATSAVFLRAVRFNSSCQPNVHAHWDPASDSMYFRVLRDIAPQEELFICYDVLSLLYTKTERQQRFFNKFGFLCNCPVCVSPSSHSDYRRMSLRRVVEDGGKVNEEELLGAIDDLHAEGLYHYRDTLYYDLHNALRHSRPNEGLTYLLAARNQCRLLVGGDDPRVRSLTESLPLDLRSHEGVLDPRLHDVPATGGGNVSPMAMPSYMDMDPPIASTATKNPTGAKGNSGLVSSGVSPLAPEPQAIAQTHEPSSSHSQIEGLEQFRTVPDNPLVPFLAITYVLSKRVLDMSRSSTVFPTQKVYIARQAMHLVVLLNDSVDMEDPVSTKEEEEGIELEDELRAFAKTLKSLDQEDSEQLDEFHRKFYRPRRYFKNNRDGDGEVDSLYLKLKAYDIRTRQMMRRQAEEGSGTNEPMSGEEEKRLPPEDAEVMS